jgi:hypothetical protein
MCLSAYPKLEDSCQTSKWFYIYDLKRALHNLYFASRQLCWRLFSNLVMSRSCARGSLSVFPRKRSGMNLNLAYPHMEDGRVHSITKVSLGPVCGREGSVGLKNSTRKVTNFEVNC